MHPLAHIALEVLVWVTVLRWVEAFVEALVFLPRVPNLMRPAHDLRLEREHELVVIVPARDEAANIRGCLESLVAQDYGNLRILAVDDRSSDATGLIMDELAVVHPHRIEVIHITVLPSGWVGKTHAMATAARHAMTAYAPAYLLFTDGDVFFEASILRRSVAHAESVGADHLVTLPTTIVRSAGEAMLLSFLQMLSLFAVRPWRVAHPRSRDCVGVGAFNLLRSEAYLHVGGYDAMRLEILEDLTLGRRIKAAGLRQRAVYAPGAVSVHWASGLVGLLHGMTKNLYAVFRFRPALLLTAAIGTALFSAEPMWLLIHPGTRMPGALALVSMLGLYWIASRRSGISPAWGLLAPVAALLLGYSMLRSMTTTLLAGGVTWRGTFYPLGELRRQAKASSAATKSEP